MANSEVTPKVWKKNFWGFFMHKKHDYGALLKYMRMLEEGYSVRFVSDIEKNHLTLVLVSLDYDVSVGRLVKDRLRARV